MLEANFAFTHADSLITDSDGFSFITVQTPNGRTQRLTGTFSFDFLGNLTGGTITGLQESLGGSQIYQVSSFALDHISWANFVLSNNAPAQRNFIFGRSDWITGSFLNDTLAGWTGDDEITGSGGNDTIYGGLGNDTATFSGNRADYRIVKGNGRITITDWRGIDGTDTLFDVERLDFADVNIAANTAPTVSVSDQAPAHGTQSIASAALFTATDADAGDIILRYEVYDATTGHGRLHLNGRDLPERTTLPVGSLDLANFDFKTSTTGNDTIWIRAFDGLAWSSWAIFEVAAVPNIAPTLSVSNKAPAKTDTFIAGADLATAADGDGDALTYRFYDGTAGNGRFTFNGNPVTEQRNFDVAAADLANFRYETSTTGNGDTLWVQVYDGYVWTAWKTFTVTAPVNITPVVNATNLTPAKGTTFIDGADLFTITDPDDANTAVQYKFYDGTTGNGHFELNGTDQPERTNITVNHADLGNLRYEVSTTGSGDTLWIQAFDGFAWGAWKTFTVAAPANIAPTVTVSNLTPAKGTTAIEATDLFTLTDPDDANTAVAYKFYDGTTGNGAFYKNGTVQTERVNLDVTQAELADFEYRPGGTAGDTLWIQAFDGTAWSAWKSFTVAAPQNNVPVVTVANINPTHGQASIAAADLYTSITDADPSDTVTAYRFYDGTAGNGRYYLDGNPAAERQNIEITAAQLADLAFRTSSAGPDVLWIQAYDGMAWSAWKSFTMAAVPNTAPVVTVANLTPATNQTAIAAVDLYDVSDADGDTITHYKFYDGTLGNGRFYLSGGAQAERANIDITAAQLADLEYRTSTAGGDTLWVQAFDGIAWSTWKSFNVGAMPEAFTGSGDAVFTWSGSVTTTVTLSSMDVFNFDPPAPDPQIQSVDTMTSQIAAAETLTSDAASVDAGGTAPLWSEPPQYAVMLASS